MDSSTTTTNKRNYQIRYKDNTPLLYELDPDDTSTFGCDPKRFYSLENSGEFDKIMHNYEQQHKVTLTQNDDLKDVSNLTDSDTASKNFVFNKSGDISSFFDSTEEVHRKYSDSDLDINTTTQGIFFLVFEKLEAFEDKL